MFKRHKQKEFIESLKEDRINLLKVQSLLIDEISNLELIIKTKDDEIKELKSKINDTHGEV